MAARHFFPPPCLREGVPAGRPRAERRTGSGRGSPDSGGLEDSPSDGTTGHAEEPGDAASAEPPRPRGRVLVVEDQGLIAMEIEDLLGDLGFEVVGTAMDAEGALRLATLHRPDFVTMDVNLGAGPDGISAATAIHQRLGIRAIFISAYGNAETMARAEAARPLGWLQKPIRRASLEATLAKFPDPLDE